MEAWDSINHVVHYIEEHLEEKMTMEELSKIAYLSPFYFQRLFKRLVGTTVMEYIKFRRLANIAEELKHNHKDTLIDICFAYGFENQETFSRNFKEAYHMTPTAYRKHPVILSHFLKPNIPLQYTIIDEDVPIVTEGIVLEITRKKLEKEKYYAGYSAMQELVSPGPNALETLWDNVHEMKKELPEWIPEGNAIGINLNLSTMAKTFHYFAGVETFKKVTTKDLETYVLPIGEYLVCQFEAENFYTLITDTIYKVYNYMYLWITNKKLLPTIEPKAFEIYYYSSLDSSYMELWIPLKEKQI